MTLAGIRGWTGAIVCAALSLAACDALVGGECRQGFVPRAGACLPSGAEATGAASGTGGVAASSTGGGGATASSGGSASGGGASSAGGVGGSGGATSGNGGSGGSPCQPPLTHCSDGCVDLQTNANDCGQCGLACATEICRAGKCSGMPIGHLVVIGMSYAQLNAPTQQLLGNASFLAPGNPLAIVDYRKYTPPADTKVTDDLLVAEAKKRGRTFDTTVVTSAAATATALDSGVYRLLFIHDQPSAPSGELASFGTAIAASAAKFAKGGGTVVVLATGSGSGEMAALLTNAALLATSGFSDANDKPAYNLPTGDAVGSGLASPFLAKSLTATLTTSETPSAKLTFVIGDAAAKPIAVHKTFGN